MLKCCVAAAFALVVSLPAFSQQTQPGDPFPFHVTLTKPDSTETASGKVFQTGKPTLVAFWLTTCIPCLAEFSAYTQNYTQWKKESDFNLIAVSLDFHENFKKIAPMAAQRKWPFPVYWDRIRAFKSILPGGLNGLPQIFLFDKDGKLVWQHKGYAQGSEQEVFDKVKALR